jgi:hypothetical protein
MLVDDQTQVEGTEAAAQTGTTETGASEGQATPSFDWEAVKSHPEFKTHAQSVYEANEEIRKEALRGVRKTDIERRAEERATELAAADRKRADELQARLDAADKAREDALLSTMTDDEQRMHVLQKNHDAAVAKLAEYESEKNKRDAEKAVDDIIGYAQKEWGLNEENAAALRDSEDTLDLFDRAMKAATKQRQAERAELDELRTKGAAKDRVLSGESTFAATGNAASGGDLSPDEIRAAFRGMGPSNPNYAKVSAAYKRVLDQYGY